MKNPFKKNRSSGAEMTESELIGAMLRSETTKETFLLLYSKLVQIRCAPKKMEFTEPNALTIESEEGDMHVLYLENLWILCQDEAETARQTIQNYLLVASRLGKELEVTRDAIIPWVKDQEYIDLFCNNSSAAKEHFVADLWIVYAAVIEGGSQGLNTSGLAKLDLGMSELRALATANLERIMESCERDDFGAWSLLSGDSNFCPGLLLFDWVWDGLAKDFPGDIVVVAPTTDSIFVTSSESADGISHIRKRALALGDTADHIVSTSLLRRVSGAWTAFD